MTSKSGSGSFTFCVEDTDGKEHEILVKYKGYYDSGNTSGPPEYCYPPEGEMEVEYQLPDFVEIDDLDTIHQQIEGEAYEQLTNREPGDD